jgi:uncharacterized Fe-S radical SAM superfamily protein PflX
MLLTCTNKGCLQSNEAKLNRKTNKVMCMECGQEIGGITDTFKKILDSQGQIMRAESKAMSVQCGACKKKCDINIKENKPFCSLCDEELQLSDTFFNMAKTMIEKGSDE